MVSHLGWELGARAKTSIRRALFEQFNRYKAHGFTVQYLHTDGEGAIASLEQEINGTYGITVNPAGPGQHVANIERKARTVKDRMRCVVSGLPWKLTTLLVVWLVFYCVSRVNMTSIAPREAFLGVKLDYKRDCRTKFGDYIEASDPYPNNSLKARTQACITLLPSGTQGTVKCLSLDTGKVVSRDQFRVLPTPDLIIKHMNALADSDSQRRGEVPSNLDLRITRDGPPLADLVEEPLNLLDHPDSVDISVPRVIAADELQIDEDTIIVEQRADTVTAPPAQEPNAIAPPTLSTIVEEEEEDADAMSALQPIELDDTPDLVVTGGDDSDDEEEDIVPFAQPPASPPPVTTTTHSYDTRSRERPRIIWYRRSGQGRTLRTRSQPHSTVLQTTLKSALRDPKLAAPAQSALEKELLSLHKKGTFHPLHDGEERTGGYKKPIYSHMFLKEKFTPDGVFDKLKGRLVAGGDMQDRAQLFDSVSAPTVAIPFVFAVASIAATEGREVVAADVPTAYLNADNSSHMITMILDKQIASALCKILPEYSPYLRQNGTILVHLRRALYGCVESARLWYNTLKRVLEADGYTANTVEPCIFNKMVDGMQVTICIFVDDLLFTSRNRLAIDHTLAYLGEVFESELTIQEGKQIGYLGLLFNFSTPGLVAITAPAYVESMLEITHTEGTAGSPASLNLFTVSPNSPALATPDIDKYHSHVARLLYLAKRTRPDLLLTVSFLTTRVQSPTEEDMQKLKRALKYVNGTRALGLRLAYNPSHTVHAYIDASYGVHDDYRSHTGMVISLGSGVIDARSTKQKLNTKSSTESELVGLSDMCGKVIWHREFLIAQGITLPPAKIYQDNQSTMHMIDRGSSTSDRTRHVAIRYYWVKDRVESKEIEVVYCPTDDMIADILTKPLVGQKFITLRNLLLNWYV
jgi:hypothetical protein